ncbi:MAG TPA: BamA/TamA family outer membrane protein, partial [Arenimonas sp.]|nr:BamA/TamA family outer membrane protein [Arenimonas sp.]
MTLQGLAAQAPRSPSRRLWRCWVWLLLLPGPAAALTLKDVQVVGVDGDARRNIELALSLSRIPPTQLLSEQRLAYLLGEAPEQARQALQPLGYYLAEVEVDSRRVGDAVSVRVQVRTGPPVRVQQLGLGIDGPGGEDPVLRRQLARFAPGRGEVLHHGRYEASKTAIERQLAARGYFAATRSQARVEVEPAAGRADIALRWSSGERYRIGAVQFEGNPFRPGLLEALVDWPDNSAFDEERLLQLQRRLFDLDYFSAVEVRALPEQDDGLVRPVLVDLLPAKRSRYRAGLRYGSDTGAGINAGYERRWLNTRGHKWASELAISERLQEVGSQYRIPAFARGGWYSLQAGLRDERLPELHTRLLQLVGNRSGRWRDWQWLAGLHWQRERYPGDGLDPDFRYVTLVYPALSLQWSRSDDPLYPRRGRAVSAELRGGSHVLGSDVDFVQLRVEGRWLQPLGERYRLLLRAEAGTTGSDNFADLPPSLRFFAGGDRSVRGYGYKRIGLAADEGPGGGRHLLVGSV